MQNAGKKWPKNQKTYYISDIWIFAYKLQKIFLTGLYCLKKNNFPDFCL